MLRIRDVYPGSWILTIPDPGSGKSTKGGENFFRCPTIFCSYKYHKIANNFIFEQVTKIILAKAQRIVVLFTQKFVIKLSKIWVWDPGSRIRKKLISGSRIQGQKCTGSRIRIRNTDVMEIFSYLPAKSFVVYAPFPYILQCTHIGSSTQNEQSTITTYLGPGLGVLDEPYPAKPAQRSSHNGPLGYLGGTKFQPT